MADDRRLIFAAIVLFYPLTAVLERMLPHRPAWRQPHGDVRTDALHLLLTGGTATGIFDATLRGAAVLLGSRVTDAIGHPLWPVGWPLPLQLGLALLVAEFGHYWFHRLSHEHPLVWRLHATHHSRLANLPGFPCGYARQLAAPFHGVWPS